MKRTVYNLPLLLEHAREVASDGKTAKKRGQHRALKEWAEDLETRRLRVRERNKELSSILPGVEEPIPAVSSTVSLLSETLPFAPVRRPHPLL